MGGFIHGGNKGSSIIHYFMKFVNVTIVNQRISFGENSQMTIEFDNVKDFISLIDSIIEELDYRRCEVTIEPQDFLFKEEEIDELEDEDIIVIQ